MHYKVTPKEAAEIIQVSIVTLGRWRKNPDHPLKTKTIRGRNIFYNKRDVEAFAHEYNGTSPEPEVTSEPINTIPAVVVQNDQPKTKPTLSMASPYIPKEHY